MLIVECQAPARAIGQRRPDRLEKLFTRCFLLATLRPSTAREPDKAFRQPVLGFISALLSVGVFGCHNRADEFPSALLIHVSSSLWSCAASPTTSPASRGLRPLARLY